MTSEQLADAIVKAFLRGGEGVVEGTLAAALPIAWVIALALHVARPYVVATTRRSSLRLAAELWWIAYVAGRDLLLVATFIGSFMYLFPDVVVAQALPLGGSLATALLFAALVVKLVADADEDPRAFQIVSYLLVAGAALYIVPMLVGVQSRTLGAPWRAVASALVTSASPGLATALCWISIVTVGALGVVAVWYDLSHFDATPTGARR